MNEITPELRAKLETFLIRFLSRVQPGSWLTVSVNRQDRTRVMFDAEAMAVASPPPVESAR